MKPLTPRLAHPLRQAAPACLTLAPGRHLLLEPEPALTLTCTAGEIWLTQHGEAEDRILRSGDSLTLAGHAALLAPLRRSTQGATLCLHRHSATAPEAVGFWSGLGRWCTRHLAPRWHSATNAHFRWRLQHGLYNG